MRATTRLRSSRTMDAHGEIGIILLSTFPRPPRLLPSVVVVVEQSAELTRLRGGPVRVLHAEPLQSQATGRVQSKQKECSTGVTLCWMVRTLSCSCTGATWLAWTSGNSLKWFSSMYMRRVSSYVSHGGPPLALMWNPKGLKETYRIREVCPMFRVAFEEEGKQEDERGGNKEGEKEGRGLFSRAAHKYTRHTGEIQQRPRAWLCNERTDPQQFQPSDLLRVAELLWELVKSKTREVDSRYYFKVQVQELSGFERLGLPQKQEGHFMEAPYSISLKDRFKWSVETLMSTDIRMERQQRKETRQDR